MYVFVCYGYSNGLGPKPCPPAASAGQFAKVAVQPGLDVFTAGILPSPAKVWDNALKPHLVFPLVSRGRAVHQNSSYLRWYLLKRDRFTDARIPAEPLYQFVVEYIHPLAALSPGVNSTVFQRDSFVRHNQVGVEFESGSETITALAGTVRAVEAEQPGR